MIDPITDMLNRIRNGQAVFKETVLVPFSKVKYEIAKILEKQGFLEKIENKGRKEKKALEITLKYEQDENTKKKTCPIILGMKRVSKPGQRIYKRAKELKPIKGGYGIAIISTPEGLMTDKDARRKKLGGEVLCEIW